MTSGWDLVQAGRYEEAIVRLREEYGRDPSNATLNNIGTAYLCAGDPEKAKAAFDEVLKDNPEREAYHWDLAGITRWLTNDFRGAVDVWLSSLSSPYQDASGGVGTALLLYYAGLRESVVYDLSKAKPLLKKRLQAAGLPEAAVYDLSKAKALLKKRLQSAWAKNWPGPLGKFVLGEIDENQVRELARFTHPSVTARQMAQVEFYQGLMALQRGEEGTFLTQMTRCVTSQHAEWIPERFLAFHEIQKFPQTRCRL